MRKLFLCAIIFLLISPTAYATPVTFDLMSGIAVSFQNEGTTQADQTTLQRYSSILELRCGSIAAETESSDGLDRLGQTLCGYVAPSWSAGNVGIGLCGELCSTFQRSVLAAVIYLRFL